MILSDHSIAQRVADGDLVDHPEVSAEQIQPASLDVRLGPQLYDPINDKTIEHHEHGSVTLHPKIPYIGHTMDYITLPNDIAALLTGRSSVGRRGVIIHKTAGWIDPGFEGELTLEMFNFSNEDQVFDVGERVGQLVFFVLDQESTGYHGQYQHQEGATK